MTKDATENDRPDAAGDGLKMESELPTRRPTRTSAAWVATSVALVLLVPLVVFILQNQSKVELRFLGFDAKLPIGVAILIAAVVGGSLVGLAGGGRVTQLRWQSRRARRQTTAGSEPAAPGAWGSSRVATPPAHSDGGR